MAFEEIKFTLRERKMQDRKTLDDGGILGFATYEEFTHLFEKMMEETRNGVGLKMEWYSCVGRKD